MIKRGVFWKTFLFHTAFALGMCAGAFGLTIYIFGHFSDWLHQIPVDTIGGNDSEPMARWLHSGIMHFSEFVHTIGVLFHHPHWPYNLAVDIIHEFSLFKLGLLSVEMLAVLLPTTMLLKRFKGYSLADVIRISNPNRLDNLIYNALSHLKFARLEVDTVFRKNLLLFIRHLEVIYSAGIGSLFGGTGIWVALGVLGGVSFMFAGTFCAINWNIFTAVTCTVFLLTFLQFMIFVSMRFLLSIDGEGRNISLLRLAKVSLEDLYVSRIRLFRVVVLPAFVGFVLVLGIASQFTLEQWFWALLSAGFVYINGPKVMLLGSAITPRFESAHFEESGKFLEQSISDEANVILLLMVSFMLPFIFYGLLISGLFSSLVFSIMVSACYGLTTLIAHFIAKSLINSTISNRLIMAKHVL